MGVRAQQDSINAPAPLMPYNYYGWGWHKGLNMNLSFSVFSQFGKHARHGVGFGERLSATYLTPLSEKLWLAIGGQVSNINWSGDSYRDMNVYAALGYRFNEHWEAYAWVQKNITDNYHSRYLYPYYYWDVPSLYGPYGGGDRIGAAVKYNLNPNVSFQVSVEGVRYPNKDFHYFDQYNYPVPEP